MFRNFLDVNYFEITYTSIGINSIVSVDSNTLFIYIIHLYIIHIIHFIYYISDINHSHKFKNLTFALLIFLYFTLFTYLFCMYIVLLNIHWVS